MSDTDLTVEELDAMEAGGRVWVLDLDSPWVKAKNGSWNWDTFAGSSGYLFRVWGPVRRANPVTGSAARDPWSNRRKPAERVSGGSSTNEGVRTLHIVAHGTPAPQGSKKHVGGGRMVETSKKLPAWRAAVEVAARLAAGPTWETIDGPVSVTGEIRIRKPATTKFGNHPSGTPDVDKLIRAIFDSLTKSKVIKDDARIIHVNIRKVWATNMPGADITITEIGDNA